MTGDLVTYSGKMDQQNRLHDSEVIVKNQNKQAGTSLGVSA